MLCKTCMYYTYQLNNTADEKKIYCGVLVPIKFEQELQQVNSCEYYREIKSVKPENDIK